MDKENIITNTVPRGSNYNSKASNYILFLISNRNANI